MQYHRAWGRSPTCRSRSLRLRAGPEPPARRCAPPCYPFESWRSEFARNLALRICEDRGIEDYGRLRALVNGDHIYLRLCQLFEAADARYNSGLFHFKREKDRHEALDELTLALELDDKLLRDILRGLYYPDSPYEFSVLSADILGQKRGAVGFIIPSTILNQVDARPVRELLLGRRLTVLVSLGQGVFGSKVLNTSTIIVSGASQSNTMRLGNITSFPLSDRSRALASIQPASWDRWKENDAFVVTAYLTDKPKAGEDIWPTK